MSLYDLTLYVADETNARRRIVSAMESAGALSPASARPLRTIGIEPDIFWERLITEGRVREATPGHYYLFNTQSQTSRQRRIKIIGFYVLMILIPIVLTLLNRR